MQAVLIIDNPTPMMDLGRWGVLLVLVWFQAGCLGRLLEATMAPQAAVAESVGNLGTQVGKAGINNDPAIQDIDRILAQNPNVANRKDLIDMRNSLSASHGGVPIAPVTTLSRRDMPLYRSLPRKAPDRLNIIDQGLVQRDGLTQSMCPVVPVSHISSRRGSRHTTDLSPVRLR